MALKRTKKKAAPTQLRCATLVQRPRLLGLDGGGSGRRQETCRQVRLVRAFQIVLGETPNRAASFMQPSADRRMKQILTSVNFAAG